jgi:5'-3' exonuclease
MNHARRTILVDGDMVAWICVYDPQGTLTPELIADRAVRKVHGWRDQLDADTAIVAFSDERRRYFRHDLMAAAGLTYKARQSELPTGIYVARKALCDAFICRTLRGLEADDVLGILATCAGSFAAAAGERVIVSNDKDLLQVPGLHFNPRTEPRVGVVSVDEGQADFNHMWQTLVGDAGDGYRGCPRVGAVAARKILWGDPEQWWPQTLMAFKARGLTEADALLQARVARILRASDYDLKTKQVIPWQPKVLAEGVA